MKTKERNTGKEKSMEQEELLNKKEVLSDEELQGVAGGIPSCKQCWKIVNIAVKINCLKNCEGPMMG